MKLKILDNNAIEKGNKELPSVFSEQVRPDIIKKAVEALQANARQPYGADPMAGKRVSAQLSKRRRDYRGCYGHGISRVPRKIMSRNGTRMNWRGAFAPGTVGGRKAHPPKAEKIFTKKINKKENRKAIRSALAATVVKDLVKQRGHELPEKYPFIISNDFEAIAKTKEVYEALIKLGFEKEIERASEKTFRTGVARLRGRKYRKRKGPLFVVSKKCAFIKAAANIAGTDIVLVNELNAELLAPGCTPGRLTLFTEAALERLDKEKLFYNGNNPAQTKMPAQTKQDKKKTKN